MTTTVAIAFANIGRGNVAQTRTAVDVIEKRMKALTANGRPAMLFLNEIDEADQAEEHGILASAFRSWDDAWWDTREPLLYTGLDVARERSWAAAPGVKHHSPSRRLHEAVFDGGEDPDVVAIGGHYPAGAHNGQRPPLARAALLGGYGLMSARETARTVHHHRAGRHVVKGMDRNWRGAPKTHPREGVVRRQGPDDLRVLPARGWEAVRRSTGSDDLGIEQLHRLHWAVLTFRPIKHPIGA